MGKELDPAVEAHRELSANVETLRQLVHDLWLVHLVDSDDPTGRLAAYQETIEQRGSRPTIYPGRDAAEVELRRDVTRRAHEKLLTHVQDLGRQVRAARPRQTSPVAANG